MADEKEKVIKKGHQPTTRPPEAEDEISEMDLEKVTGALAGVCKLTKVHTTASDNCPTPA